MDIITGLGSGITGYIIPFLFVLTIVVFFHELGHFWVGRLCSVKIDAFSVGFGPEIFGWNDKQGTRWKFSAIPLGGYVKFSGDSNAASLPDGEALEEMSQEDFEHTLAGRPVWQRAAIVAAGPIANFLLAIVILAGLFIYAGKVVTDPRADGVEPGSAAERAGVQVGDIITSIDGTPIESFSDMKRIVSANADIPLNIVILRDGQDIPMVITPERRETTDRWGNVHREGLLGVKHDPSLGVVRTISYSVPEALVEAVKETWFIITRTLGYLYDIIIGRESADQLSGPIGIAKVSGQVAELGLGAMLNLAAILSVSIGLLNLFPIPMLDGGHLVYYAAEAIRGKPLSERVQEIGFRIGLTLVLMLMVFATWNDIAKMSWPSVFS